VGAAVDVQGLPGDVPGAAGAFFAGLSSSLQRYHVDNVNAAKGPETRRRRIEKAVSLFQQGKPRWGPAAQKAGDSVLESPAPVQLTVLRTAS
jgi:hypothetical protein